MATTDLLQKAAFLQHVNLARLEQRVERVSFGVSDIIIREGEIGDAAYIIDSGAVQVYITTADGAEIVTARLQAGAHFGEQALLQANNRRNASIRAAEDTIALRIPADAMMEILIGDSAFREQLAELGARRMHSVLPARVRCSRAWRSMISSGSNFMRHGTAPVRLCLPRAMSETRSI